MSPPILSILIPTYNRVASVVTAVKSVGTFPDVEIIVIDNCSHNDIYIELKDLLDELQGLNIRLFRNSENIGMVENWNTCISHATGSWMGLLCSDDEYLEGAIASILSFISQNKEPCLIIQDPSLHVPIEHHDQGVETVKNLNLPILSGNFWHRSISEKLGGFNVHFKYSADVEFWYRIASSFSVIKFKEPFAKYIEHETNYMWETWEKSDFLSQMEDMSRQIKLYKYPSISPADLTKEVQNDIWRTIIYIISHSARTNRIYLFSKYVIAGLTRANSKSNFWELFKSTAGASKLLLSQHLKAVLHSNEKLS